MLIFMLAAALALPQSISTPVPVSPITWTGAVYSQSYPVVASNGSMTFAAWSDYRFSTSRAATIGTRVGADGRPLDPLGIVIPAISSTETAFWSGEEFVVIGRSPANGRAIVSIGVDGSTSTPKTIDVPPEYTFAALSSTGADARLLYIRYDANEVLNARIVNARGDVVASIATPLAIPLAAPPAGSRWIAAGRKNDFGIFGPSATVRLGRDGTVLANTSVHWPFQYFFTDIIAIAGNDGQGFVLLRGAPSYTPDPPSVLACQIDNNAAFTGKSAEMYLPWFFRLNSHPVIVATGDSYIVVNAGIFGDLTPHQYVSRISFDLSSTPRDVSSAGSPLQFQMENGQRVLIANQRTGLFLQTIGDTLEASVPVQLNVQATTQSLPSVAATTSSYAVAWYERGSDSGTHALIRRWWPDGEPIDPAPLEVSAAQYPPGLQPALAFMSDMYIVNGRRLSATGGWIDDQSRPNIVAAASNGTDFLLASGGALTRVPRGTASSVPVALPGTAQYPRIASNGTDYLVVWSASYGCAFDPCPIPPAAAYALPVRPDGSWIHAAPTVLSPVDTSSPSVVWTGSSYLAAWIESGGVRATRIAADGTLLDNGVVIDHPNGNGLMLKDSLVVPFNGDVIFFMHYVPPSVGDGRWIAVRVRPDDLASAASAERTVLPPTAGQLAAASLGGRLMLAYDTSTDPNSGYVPRVYVEQLADPPPRRRAVGR